MKILTLSGDKAASRFELLYAALQNGGGPQADRSPAVIRREARLFDLLDAISTPLNGNPDRRMVIEGEHVLTLSPEDVTLLSDYSQKTPWVPKASRAAVDLWQWLDNADTKE